MATLHMDVETARGTQNTITSTYSQLNNLLSSMTNTVSGLQPSWMGNSATEFFNEYESWKSNMNNLLQNLDTLGKRLSSEITEWENVASKLA